MVSVNIYLGHLAFNVSHPKKRAGEGNSLLKGWYFFCPKKQKKKNIKKKGTRREFEESEQAVCGD